MRIKAIHGIGPAIIQAIQERSTQAAKAFNVQQAEKYLRYCRKTGDKTLINYAEKRLNEAKL